MPFRPNKLRRIWHALGAYSRRDPTLFVASFAIWMALSGLSLVVPGEAFEAVQVYSIARELGMNENLVGAAMLANAAVLAWSLGDRPPRVRAWVAYMSGAIWVFWSLLMLFSGLQHGFLAASAIWTIIASFSLINAAWPLSDGAPVEVVRPPLPPSPRPWDPSPPTLRQGAV